MSRNVYFSQAVKSEQHLYEDLVIESLKIYGQEVYYIPRSIINRDSIMNEDIASSFEDAYMIEAYIENPDGFEGAGDLYSKFGLEIRDEANFILARKTWDRLVGLWNNDITVTTPQEGDLIYLPLSNSMFEINMVEHEQPFYQLSQLPVYKLQCSLFEYNEENFETGIDAIDNLEQANTYQIAMDISTTSGEDFVVGETVTQLLIAENGATPAISVYGTVQNIDKDSNTRATISVSNIGALNSNIARSFLVTANTLLGSENAYTATILKVYDISDNDTNNVFPSDSNSQNVAMEFEADSILDFSENNPFGDPSENY
jgi:hypothetical protein